jgi:hypothetical protein
MFSTLLFEMAVDQTHVWGTITQAIGIGSKANDQCGLICFLTVGRLLTHTNDY